MRTLFPSARSRKPGAHPGGMARRRGAATGEACGGEMALTVGGFALMPAGMNHYAYTKKETTILLHGMGPVEFTYVNPADDPRNAGKK